jgi:hypothetical protein
LSFAAIDEKHTEDAFEKKENTERKRQQGRQGPSSTGLTPICG